MADISSEPSMEEILSSIKRIIAEDSATALAAPKPRRAVAAAMPVADRDDDDADEPEVLELTQTVPAADVAAEPVAAPKVAAAAVPATDRPALVSEATAEASRAPLAALSSLIVKPEVHGGDTLEGLLREMLKPMLAEWLEARLPDIVERMVAREISRITDRG